MSPKGHRDCSETRNNHTDDILADNIYCHHGKRVTKTKQRVKGGADSFALNNQISTVVSVDLRPAW